MSDRVPAMWRTGSAHPPVEDRDQRAAAWALDRAPDSSDWASLTAHFRTPDQLWQARRVAEAFARFEQDHITRLESDVAIARAALERAIKFLEGSNPLHMSGGIRNCDLRDLLGEALSRISGENRHG